MNLYMKQKQAHRHSKQSYGYGYQSGNRGWINQEFWINRYTLLYIKQVNSKELLYSTGNYIQTIFTVITIMEKNVIHIHTYTYIFIYIYMNHFALHHKLTQHCKSTIPPSKKKKRERERRRCSSLTGSHGVAISDRMVVSFWGQVISF